ncbi:hypothetical protein [Streptomyces sp. NPDC059491]|uniref:hypothetical protein n=1 Tax=Streptomyces sp. NPDC059491 TaxID=3346850 RepID=UPI003694522F
MLEKPRSDEVRSRPRGLARLSSLESAEEELALYLRELHARLGMTSKDLAVALTEMKPADAVSTFQLSRCLGGKSLPKLSLIARMHELLALRTDGLIDQEGVRIGRALVFAAAQAKGPLMAREYKLEAALEDLAGQRVRTAEELEGLRAGLEEERRQLTDLEEELHALSEQAFRERREVAEEREEIVRRIAVLEDRVAQHESVLHLMRQEEEHVVTMMAAAGKEIEVWRSRDSGGDRATRVGGEGVPAARRADEVIVLRELGSDDAADGLMREYVDAASLSDLVELYAAFDRQRRPLETRRLANLIALRRPARDVLRLSTHVSADEGLPQHEDSRLLAAAGTHAPMAELLLLLKLLRETSQTGRFADVGSDTNSRPDEEIEQLRSAGVPVRGPRRTAPESGPEPEPEAGKRRFWSR